MLWTGNGLKLNSTPVRMLISDIKDKKVISYDYSYRQPPEEQYIPSRLVLQILKNLRRYQPDDLDNYRTVEELAEVL